MILQMVFGMTLNPLSMYLRFGRRILVALLSNEPDAAIRVPSLEEIREFMDIIKQKHPLLMEFGAQWTG